MRTLLALCLTALVAGSSAAAVTNIVCWGDSITEGMAMPRGKSYPARLQALLGKGYRVFNSGDGGEDVTTIPARQGALPLKTAAKLAFAAGERKIRLGDASENGFHTTAGRPIKLTQALGRDVPVNPVLIGERHYRLSFTDFHWNTATLPISYTLWLERDDAKEAETIEESTPVVFNSVAAAREAYCEIFLMGANGGWNNDVAELIDDLQMMVNVRGRDKPYLVIVPFWGGFRPAQVNAVLAAFGKHAIDFRGESLRKGLSAEKLTPTPKDIAEITEGRVPTSLLYKNTPNCHLNEFGYDYLAKLVHARGRELGYW